MNLYAVPDNYERFVGTEKVVHDIDINFVRVCQSKLQLYLNSVIYLLCTLV